MALALLPLLGACSALPYYAQSVRGQLGLMAASRPIEQVLADPVTPPGVHERLVRLPALRRFAHEELGLPDSGSYRLYADLGREAVIWSVVAAPEDSLTPRQWCYPVIGCASYRGYFRKQAAVDYAADLAGQGWDVAVEPVPAYSTLGWFNDPLPSTVIEWPVADIAALLFHELAHEKLYVPDDSAFNEAYASVVEQQGVRRWVELHGSEAQRHEHALRTERRDEFLALLAATRERLSALYGAVMAREAMLLRKAEILSRLRGEYAALKARWGGYAGYDRWFDRPVNNAHLASIGTYYAWKPAFRRLFEQAGGDWPAFHAACQVIAELPQTDRHARLQALSEREPGG